MSHRDKTRGSLAPGPLRSLAPAAAPPGSTPREKPEKDVHQCIRHDARSAYHALSGFVELLTHGSLGAISDDQRHSLGHIRSSAHQLLELIESSVELSRPQAPRSDLDLRVVSLEAVLVTLVHSMVREQPGLQLELQRGPATHDLLVQVELEPLMSTLHTLVQLVAGPTLHEVQLRLSQTDLHAVLVISALHDDASVTQSMPLPHPALSNVDGVSDLLESRTYVRLKRCESLLRRQHGKLMIAEDLGRVRLALPKA